MIIRAKRQSNYTIMSNTGLNDSRLSFKAKGVLAYLLSKPDGWVTYRTQLTSIGPDGDSAVGTALQELEQAGYLQRERTRADDGRFTGYATVVSDEPQGDFPHVDNPNLDNPNLDYPNSDNRPLVSTDSIVSTEDINYSSSSSSVVYEKPDDGEDIQKVFQVWRDSRIAQLTPILEADIIAVVNEVGVESFLYGIKAAVGADVKKPSYVYTCARNHASGKGAPGPPVVPGKGGLYDFPTRAAARKWLDGLADDRKRDVQGKVSVKGTLVRRL